MPNDIFTIAYKYHTLGRCIIPSGGGADGKAALTPWKQYQTERPTDEQIENWQRELNPTVWAMITGLVSSCFVLDCDSQQAVAMMEAAELKPHIKTAKGYHYYCRLPSWTISTKVGILPGIDIRGQGGYVNFCGKNDKVAYEVLIMPTDEALITFEQLPAELQRALQPKPKTLADQILQEALSKAQPGNRNETGFWLACQLRDNNIPQANAEAIMRSYVAKVGNIGLEPYTEQEAIASIEQSYKTEPREPWHPPTQYMPDTTLPEIQTNGRWIRDMTHDALESLYSSNSPERIFRRAGSLVRVTTDEGHRPSVDTLNEPSLGGLLDRCANYYKVARGEVDWIKTKAAPPLKVVRDCLSLSEWQFPALAGITEIPVLRPDGSILTETGYDRATRLYYHPAVDLRVPLIPDNPSSGEVEAAKQLILEVIINFPFDSEASRANAIAAMITPILRPLIVSPLPLSIFDKPQAGTGATFLAEVISLITTGRSAAMMTAPRTEEEWGKVITVQVLKGRSIMVIDNVERKLRSPSLSALLTSRTWNGRILGKSDDITFPNIIMPIATGNNIQLGGDLPRRCVWVRMDAKMPKPWLRPESDFKHSNLTDWVTINRGAILGAILTATRAWIRAGMPETTETPNLGTYESYCRVVGGVLEFMGIKGFLQNLAIMYDEMDIESQQWEAFLEAWMEYIGQEPTVVSDIEKILDNNEDFRRLLPDDLKGKDTRSYSRRLGSALSKQNGVRYPNGLMLIKAGHKRTPAIAWQVLSYESTDSADLATNAKLAKLCKLFPTPRRVEGELNEKEVQNNLTNLPSATKRGENAKLAKKAEGSSGDIVGNKRSLGKYPSKPCLHCGTDEPVVDGQYGTYKCSKCGRHYLPESDSVEGVTGVNK